MLIDSGKARLMKIRTFSYSNIVVNYTYEVFTLPT